MLNPAPAASAAAAMLKICQVFICLLLTVTPEGKPSCGGGAR
jgi:hypothetical protein